MIIHCKNPVIECYVCAHTTRVAVFDDTMVAFICAECLPHCVNAGRALVRAGIPSSSADTDLEK